MDLTPQDLWSLRNVVIRAVNEAHEILAAAARRSRADAGRVAPAPVAAPAPAAPTPPKAPRLTYSLKETARLLSLSPATLYRMIAAGDLATLKIGSRRFVKAADLEALLSRSQGAAGRRR